MDLQDWERESKAWDKCLKRWKTYENIIKERDRYMRQEAGLLGFVKSPEFRWMLVAISFWIILVGMVQ